VLVLASAVDMIGNADAWTYHLSPGALREENTRPAMMGQVPAVQPMTFRAEDRSPGFKLAVDRIMRLGGIRGTPRGPSLSSSPRLRRRIPNPPGPIGSNRSVQDMAAGLIPNTPTYELFLRGGSDTYVA
jgi:hypothetical protein